MATGSATGSGGDDVHPPSTHSMASEGELPGSSPLTPPTQDSIRLSDIQKMLNVVEHAASLYNALESLPIGERVNCVWFPEFLALGSALDTMLRPDNE